MRIGIVTNSHDSQWSGAMAALFSFYEGLLEIGQDAVIGKRACDLKDPDFIFLSNTSCDLRGESEWIEKKGKPFGVIAFHADRSKYYSPCYGFAHFVGLCMEQGKGPSFYTIDQLIENPDIIDFFSYAPPPLFEGNYPVLERAKVCIATAPTEAATLRRDSPSCNAQVIYLEPGIPDAVVEHKNSSFLEWTGLQSGEYVIQVGRIELRKNQLGSILAMKDLDMPLVLIALPSYNPVYEEMCLRAILRYRRAPTWVISQNLPTSVQGSLRILQMPEGKKLSEQMLISAYQHAGLHLHPAFCELPGLTYLEGAKLGVPTIASEWTTIKDYFTDPKTGAYTLDDRIVYTPPHHLRTITEQIRKQFGRKIDRSFSHPAFQRKRADVARELIQTVY
ncbi:MAG: hypothetical protein V4492_03410 [Chlamydiota bacterium]